jgi:hypothetical protein
MKRATVVVALAILALVLVYPAATPSAAAPGSRDVPTIQIISHQPGDPTIANSGDEGDADDLAGARRGKSNPTGSSIQSDIEIQAGLAVKVWQMYFFVFGLHR